MVTRLNVFILAIVLVESRPGLGKIHSHGEYSLPCAHSGVILFIANMLLQAL